MNRGFYTIMAAQFFSALADNALLIAAIALLRDMHAPSAYEPLLKTFFTLSYVVLAAFVGAFADSMPKWRVMFISNGIKILGCGMMFLGLHPLLAFAVVGNFEDAVASWRQDATRFPNPNDGVVLAATAGAINVRLGGRALGDPVALPAPATPTGAPADDAAVSTDGREPQLAHLGSVVGLVWRSVVMWLLLLALLTLARLP